MSLPDQSTTQSDKEIMDLDSMFKKILFALNPEGLEKEAPMNLDRSLYLEERFAMRCKIPDSKLYYDIINHPTLGNLYIFYSPKAGCLYASINQKNNVCELFFLDRKYHYFSENNRQYCLLSKYIIPYRNTFYGKIDLNEKNPSINVYIQNETLKNTNLLNFTESSTDSNLNSQNLSFSEANLTNLNQNSKINSKKEVTFRDTLLTFQKDSNKNNKDYNSEPIKQESQKALGYSSNSTTKVKPPMVNSDNKNLKKNNNKEDKKQNIEDGWTLVKGKQVIPPTGHTNLKNIEAYNNPENNQNLLSSKSHIESLEKLDNSNSQSVKISDQKNKENLKTKLENKKSQQDQNNKKKEEEDKLLEQEINKNKSKKEEDELLKKNLIKEKIAFNIKISSVYQNFLKEIKENEPDNSDKKARIKQILKIFQEFKSDKNHVFYNFIDEINKSHLKQKKNERVKIINNLQTEEIFYNLQFFSLLTIDEENSKEIIRFLEFLTSDQFLKEYKKFSEKNTINFSEINFVQGDTQNIKNGFNWYNFLEFISYICVRHEDYSSFDKFIDFTTRNEFKDFLFLNNSVLINSFFNFLKDKNNNQMNNFAENLNKNLNHVKKFYFKKFFELNYEFYNNFITFLEFFYYSLEIQKKNPEDDKDDIKEFIKQSFEFLDKSCFKSEFDHIEYEDLLCQMKFFINYFEKQCIKFLQNYNLYADFFLHKDSFNEIYTNNDTWNVFNKEVDTRTKEIENKIDSVISKIFEKFNKKELNENKSDFEKEMKEFNFSYYETYYKKIKNQNDSSNVELLNLESFENDTKFQEKFLAKIFCVTYKEIIECLKRNPNRSYFSTMNFLIFIKEYLEKNKNFFTLCIAFLNTLYNQNYSNKNEKLQKAELIILEEFINLVNSYSKEFSEYLKSTKQQDSFIIDNLEYIFLNKNSIIKI